MRNLQKTLAFFGIVITSSIGQLVGCANDAGNCELNYEPCPGSSGVVAPPPGCTDSPSQNPAVIQSDCAYFVGGDKASDSNTGGESDPFASLAAAVTAAAKNKARVYLCGSVNERVDVPAGVSIFGGFDCSGPEWNYDAAKPAAITPPAPASDAPFQSSIRISGDRTTNIEDVNIVAAEAGFAGGSSIAVIIDKATVNFLRSDLTAGNGTAGIAGETLVDDSALNGVAGTKGGDICTAGATNPGGAESVKSCADGTMSIGGKGGDGGLIDVMNMNKELAGGDGADGVPGLGAGAKGVGEPESGNWSCATIGNGQAGEPGAEGKDGTGAQGNGAISATGFAPIAGTAGEGGMPGQGGGGGGGVRGKVNVCGSIRTGASGGSGGSGGCGGKGGGGGTGGGASIALISLNAKVTLTGCTITAQNGGDGGNGGTGQTGGSGAAGAAGGNKSGGGSIDACFGGTGGDGGAGGRGGGGAGGPAAGIAYTGTTPTLDSTSTISKGSGGNGGQGGENNAAGNQGSNGASQDTLSF